jgi:hypothetical protein
VKKYIVRLRPAEQRQRSQRIRSGQSAARTLLQARILLKTDTDSAAPAGSDEALGEALEVPSATVARVRQRFVEEGLEAALRPKASRRQYPRKLDAAARLIAWRAVPPRREERAGGCACWLTGLCHGSTCPPSRTRPSAVH